jgi:hypothetical protein
MTIRGDVDARLIVTKAIGPVSIATNTTTTSAAIDTTAYPSGVRLLIVHSTGTYTDGSYIASVTDATTSGGSYSAATLFSGTLSASAAANLTKTATFVTQPGRPFVKVQIVSTGTTTGALNSVHVVAVPPAMV